MMKFTGKSPLLFVAWLTLILSGNALAAIDASVDRSRVALGDTFRLTITATDDEDISDANLRPLLEDFQILQRSTNNSINFINGKRSQTSELSIDLAPLREGNLFVPALEVGKHRTQRIAVTVTRAADVNTGDESVIFSAQVDSDSVYVQGQVILTLTLQQAIELSGRQLTELEMDNAFVKQLEQKTFNRAINGRQWLVTEIRYAIFPEQSGTLQIPAQAFSGRVREGRRSFFNQGSGRLLRRTTEPLSIAVKPRPSEFTGSNWLPARQVTIEERWSTPPGQLRAGESATRTIRIQGEGVQGAQLPPVLFPPTDGIKFYPDQPQISEQEVSSGLLGSRQDSAAVVPTRAGTWSIDEVRIPWWDTNSEQIRYAVLPAREITVAAADPATITTPSPTPQATTGTGQAAASTEQSSGIWKPIGIISLLGWALTLAYLWQQRRTGTATRPAATENMAEKSAFKRLLRICEQNDPGQARAALIDWARLLTDNPSLHSLHQVAALTSNKAIQQVLFALDRSLYGTASGSWHGAVLGESMQALRDEYVEQRKAGRNKPLNLYPVAA